VRCRFRVLQIITTVVVSISASACGNTVGPLGGGTRNGPIAFMVLDSSANWNIWTTDGDGTHARALTFGAGTRTQPEKSPDGTLIAYVSSDAPSGLWVMDTSGRNARPLTPFVGYLVHLAWSPDSKRIAMAGDIADQGAITVINADGTNYATIGVDTIGADMPTWSPNGSTIVFRSSSMPRALGSPTALYRMNADGSQVELLYLPPTGQEVGYPAWSPDGKRLAFAMGPEDAYYRLFVANADGSAPRPITTTPDCNGKPLFDSDVSPTWSPDGGWIAFQRQRGPCAPGDDPYGVTQIYVVSGDGDFFGQVSRIPVGSLAPSW
jgi:TolB protein